MESLYWYGQTWWEQMEWYKPRRFRTGAYFPWLAILFSFASVATAQDAASIYDWSKPKHTREGMFATVAKTGKPAVIFVGVPSRQIAGVDLYTSPRYTEGGSGIQVVSRDGTATDIHATATDAEITALAFPRREVIQSSPFAQGPVWDSMPGTIAPNAATLNTSSLGGIRTGRIRTFAPFAQTRGGISSAGCSTGG